MELPDKLSCGHDRSCSYFHPALRGGARWRCSECDKAKFTEPKQAPVIDPPRSEEPVQQPPMGRVSCDQHIRMLQVGVKWGMIIGLVIGFCIGLSLGTILSRFY